MTETNTAVILSRKALAAGVLSAAMLCTAMSSAQAASCSIPKSYYKHVSCTASSQYFLAVKDSGAPVALLNKSGKQVVDLSRYQKVAADKLAGGLMPVQRLNKVGYVNMSGREVVPAVYDVLVGEAGSGGWARPVVNERIVVKKNGNFGIINTSNQVIEPFSASYSSISNFSNGAFRVQRGAETIWLDKNGKTTSNPGPTVADSSGAQGNNTPLTVAEQRKLATTFVPDEQDGKWGFVDGNDVTMITYSFDQVTPFSEGLAGVRVADNWGFISPAGDLVIGFRFNEDGVIRSGSYQGQPPFVFKNGKAWVGNLNNGDKLCVNTQGTNVAC